MTEWSRAPATLVLPPGTVHVWRARLRLPAGTIARLGALLSEDERARAARLRSARLKADFEAGRGIQREILSRYTGITPASLVFSYSAHGKPALLRTGRAPGLTFNISNAGGVALVAVTTTRRIGIDLEPIRPVRQARAIANRFFSTQEAAVLRSVGPEDLDRTFLTTWTRKEAFIKAVGEGLSLPLAAFDVACAPGEPARLLRTRPQDRADEWTMVDIEPAAGFVGSMVFEGAAQQIELFDLDAERD